MSKIIPLKQIPSSNIFPDDVYRLKVQKLEGLMSAGKDGKTPKFMLKLVSQIVEPKQYANMLYFQQFVIGTEDDPDADLVETWQQSIGGKEFKRFIGKCGVPFGDEASVDEVAAALPGSEHLQSIIQETETKEGPYKGTIRNKTTAFWSLGEKEAGTGAQRSRNQANGKAKPVATGTTATDEVSCSACKKRVPRATLKAHVQAHMDELARSGGQTGNDAEADE